MTQPPSTRNLEPLGSIDSLRRTAQAQAVLALLSSEHPEQRYRKLADGLEAAGSQNGSGDDLLLLFSSAGALIRGFDHESLMSPYNPDVALAHLSDDELEELSEEEEARLLDAMRPFPGVLDDVPTVLREQLEALDEEPRRPVPVPSVLTFCIWRTPADPGWNVGRAIAFPEHDDDDPDGSAFLLRPYAGGADAYLEWAEEAFGRPVSRELVERVYAFEPLTPELADLGRVKLELEALGAALGGIGYPSALGGRVDDVA